MSTPIIISIDPGYDRCGVAVVTLESNREIVLYSNCITTNKKDGQEIRLSLIYQTISDIISKWHPTHLAIETLFFSVNKTTALKVAEARGMVLTLAGLHHLILIELSPQAVKLGVTGSGSADKPAVQKMVSLILKTDISSKIDDEIDAIAVGITAIQELKLKSRI